MFQLNLTINKAELHIIDRAVLSFSPFQYYQKKVFTKYPGIYLYKYSSTLQCVE